MREAERQIVAAVERGIMASRIAVVTAIRANETPDPSSWFAEYGERALSEASNRFFAILGFDAADPANEVDSMVSWQEKFEAVLPNHPMHGRLRNVVLVVDWEAAPRINRVNLDRLLRAGIRFRAKESGHYPQPNLPPYDRRVFGEALRNDILSSGMLNGDEGVTSLPAPPKALPAIDPKDPKFSEALEFFRNPVV